MVDKDKKGNEVTGFIISGAETAEKETGTEVKLGWNFDKNEFVSKSESIDDGKMKKVEEGTYGVDTVTQKEGEGTKIAVGLDPHVDFGIGTGVGVNISAQDEE